MTDALASWAPVIAATVLGLPVAALVAAGLAIWRTRGGTPRPWAWATAAMEVGLVAGTLPWIWMILTPRPGPGGLELVPGRGLAEVVTGDASVAVVQVGGNLLVFAAFGLLAPIRWPLGVAAVAGCAAAGSVVVEALQYALQLGRVSSVDDVALNTLGAVLAALASRPWWHRRARPCPAQ